MPISHPPTESVVALENTTNEEIVETVIEDVGAGEQCGRGYEASGEVVYPHPLWLRRRVDVLPEENIAVPENLQRLKRKFYKVQSSSTWIWRGRTLLETFLPTNQVFRGLTTTNWFYYHTQIRNYPFSRCKPSPIVRPWQQSWCLAEKQCLATTLSARTQRMIHYERLVFTIKSENQDAN